MDLKTGVVVDKTLPEHFETLIEEIMLRIVSNPFLAMHEFFLERELMLVDTAYIHNCRSVRGYIGKVISDKKKLNQKAEEATDIVSLLLHETSYEKESEIIDDIIVLFMAGSATI